MNRRVGWTLALLATITYSTNTPIGRGAILAGLDPVTLLTARFVTAGLLFGVTLGVTSVGYAQPGQMPVDRRGFWIALASGVLNGIMIACIFVALTRVSASVNSMITIALIPTFTLLLLAWRGEPLTVRNLTRLGIGLAGLYLLVGAGGRVDPGGVALLVIGSALYAIHMVSVQWFLRPYNTWMITTLIVVGAGAVLALMWLARGADTYVPGWFGWTAILFQSVVATYLGRMMTYNAVKIIGSGQFTLLAPLETMLTIVWSVLFLDERLAPLQWLGAVLILVGALLAADVVWQRVTRRWHSELRTSS